MQKDFKQTFLEKQIEIRSPVNDEIMDFHQNENGHYSDKKIKRTIAYEINI